MQLTDVDPGRIKGIKTIGVIIITKDLHVALICDNKAICFSFGEVN